MELNVPWNDEKPTHKVLGVDRDKLIKVLLQYVDECIDRLEESRKLNLESCVMHKIWTDKSFDLMSQIYMTMKSNRAIFNRLLERYGREVSP